MGIITADAMVLTDVHHFQILGQKNIDAI